MTPCHAVTWHLTRSMLLNLFGLAKAYGDDQVLNNVTLSLHAGNKWGLVGANGVGKSTLLKIIVGAVEPDAGSVAVTPGVSLGYLPQVLESSQTQTLAELVASARLRCAPWKNACVRWSRRWPLHQSRRALGRVWAAERSVRTPGRLRPGLPHGGSARRPGHRPPGPRAGGRDALGRREGPRRAGRLAPRGARPAVARRADQPPGLSGHGLAGVLLARLPGRLPGGLP